MLDPSRVALRAQDIEADEDLLYRVWSDLDTWEERSPDAPAAVGRPAFREKLRSGQFDGGAHFVVTLDGEGVGRTTIFHEDTLARHAEVGIALLAQARGQGVGTEALRQTVEFAFVRRNLRRVHLVVLATNTAGIRSYEKVGFVVEGRRREHCWVRGEYVDEVIMGLMRADWSS
jgi:RimJ/RimL family protein N-acetyltransferase